MRTAHTTYQPRKTLRTASVLALTILASLVVSASPAAPGGTPTTPTPETSLTTVVSTSRLALVRTTISTGHRTWSYGWPVKPFDRQHPVRSFLNDPRIGANGGASFHFGVDIAVPDGTPVYAVEAGTIWFDNPQAIAVVALDRSHSFGYWHVTPVVKSHQRVACHQLIAYVARGWGHVHFAERRGGAYVNPLRNGGLGPYADHTAPTVDEVHVYGSSLAAVAHDTPDPRVPGAWANEPVTPALLRWRIVRSGRRRPGRRRWTSARRCSTRRASQRSTRRRPGRITRARPAMFSFYLARTWRPNAPATVQVEVSDTAGNVSVYTARVATIEAGL